MNKNIKFIKPKLELIELEDGTKDDFYCKLKVSPLKRGYGMTIGNSLRRVLLSSIPGAAALAIRIEGVAQEFCAVEGIKEDVTEIVLNVKNIVFTINKEDNEKGDYGDEKQVYEIYLNAKNPDQDELVVTAGDINLGDYDFINVVNKDQPICTLTKGGKIEMTLLVRNGVGYVSSTENNKEFCHDAYSRINGFLAIDSIFTPVERCKYEVSKTRYEDDFDCDQLVIEVWTNGSTKATNAISLAAKFLIDQFKVIEELNTEIAKNDYMDKEPEKANNAILDLPIEEFGLDIRPYNCLKRAQINTVGDLVEKTEEEMMKVRNLGRKSLKQVMQILHSKGLHLKNETSYFDSTDEDEEESSHDEE